MPKKKYDIFPICLQVRRTAWLVGALGLVGVVHFEVDRLADTVDSGLAEADFREAITLAQKMSAKAWELRTTTSLARLLRQEGKVEQARQLLSEIYISFTEGFDTADLKDAESLLDELES